MYEGTLELKNILWKYPLKKIKQTKVKLILHTPNPILLHFKNLGQKQKSSKTELYKSIPRKSQVWPTFIYVACTYIACNV